MGTTSWILPEMADLKQYGHTFWPTWYLGAFELWRLAEVV